jgi:hypothetical protein
MYFVNKLNQQVVDARLCLSAISLTTCRLDDICKEVFAHSPQKMHMRSCMRAYATVQKLLCHETIANYLGSCASIVQDVVAARPTAVSTKPVA